MISPTESDVPSKNSDSWSRYWALQPSHSLAGTFDAGYGQAISTFWRGISQKLPDSAAVLDLATGNGPLPRLFLHNRPDLKIDAIDAAIVTPTWKPPKGSFAPRFHSQVSCETLPFADAAFDLVTSQYGFEYSSLNLSLAEVARTLRPGGTFAAIVHSSDSRIVEVTRDEAAHVNLLTGPKGAIKHVMEMVKLMPMASTREGRSQLDACSSARSTRDNFNGAMNHIQAAANAAVAPDLLFEFLHWVPQVLATAGTTSGAAAALQHCHNYQLQLEDADERYRALLKAAFSTEERAGIASRMGQFDLHLQNITTVLQDEYILGIALVAHRR